MPTTTIEETSYTPQGRFLLEIIYDGSGYSGWQIQPHRVAVQEVMQKTLTRREIHPPHRQQPDGCRGPCAGFCRLLSLSGFSPYPGGKSHGGTEPPDAK